MMYLTMLCRLKKYLGTLRTFVDAEIANERLKRNQISMEHVDGTRVFVNMGSAEQTIKSYWDLIETRVDLKWITATTESGWRSSFIFIENN